MKYKVNFVDFEQVNVCWVHKLTTSQCPHQLYVTDTNAYYLNPQFLHLCVHILLDLVKVQ